MKPLAYTSFDVHAFESEIDRLMGMSNDELYGLVMNDPEAPPLMLVLVERLQAYVDEMTRMEGGIQPAAPQDA